MAVIAKSLKEDDKNWTRLWNNVKDQIKSKRTLSCYLQYMREEDMVLRQAKHSKTRPRYSLNRKSHKVHALLGQPPGELNVYVTIELNRLKEDPFIALVCSSTTSYLLNLLHWYAQKGQGRADAMAFQEWLHNLLDHIRTLGDYTAARVEEGSYDLNLLAAASERVRGNVRREQVTLAEGTGVQPLITDGVRPLKIVIGEMQWKPIT
jgi:hypothetical protein